MREIVSKKKPEKSEKLKLKVRTRHPGTVTLQFWLLTPVSFICSTGEEETTPEGGQDGCRKCHGKVFRHE